MTRLFLLLLVGVISCQTSSYKEGAKNTNEDKEIALKQTYQRLQFDNRVNTILKEFIDEAKCKDCINEMHVDKVRPDEIIVTLKSRVYSIEYLSKTNPLFTSTINGVRFNVYSGLEDVFVGDKTNFDYSVKDSSNTVFKVWSIFVKPDSIRVEKDTGYPFFPGETPNIKIK
jgi:hypothetical protein